MLKERLNVRGLKFAAALIALVLAPIPASALSDPEGLWQQVTVYRDQWGVPHVYGETPRAMAFGFGYAQAEDRLPTLLMAYRVANGRAAEVMGPSYAESDAFALRASHAELAALAWPNADPVTRNLCEGFALGVTAWMVDHPGEAPPWASGGVRPQDVLAFWHCYIMGFAPFDLPGEWRRNPPSTGGGAWAVDGLHTKSGAPILVINPHTRADDFFQWYEAHLDSQTLRMSGATLVGLPMLMMGHNGRLGWALTPNKADWADIYLVPEEQIKINVDPNSIEAIALGQLAYAYQLRTRAEEMRQYYVRTGGGLESREVRAAKTSLGPVMGTYNGKNAVWVAGGYFDLGGLRQLTDMAVAQDLDAFQAALVQQQLPCFHVVYADNADNLFYVYNAKVGNKTQASEAMAAVGPPAGSPLPMNMGWRLPVDGTDTRLAWGGIVPVGYMPSTTNPVAGFIQACGTPPVLSSGAGEIAETSAPRWLVNDRDTDRARRVRDVLQSQELDLAGNVALVLDDYVPLAEIWVPRLQEAAVQHPDYLNVAHPDVPLALAMLDEWDYRASLSSVATTVFHVWWQQLRIGLALQFPDESDQEAALAVDSADLRELALRALSEAVKVMRNEFGRIDVAWETANAVPYVLGKAPFQGSTEGGSVFSVPGGASAEGMGYAMVVELGEIPDAVSLTPFGVSENRRSPHADDQLELLQQRRMKPAWFAREEVIRNARRAMGRHAVFQPIDSALEVRVTASVPCAIKLAVYETAPVEIPIGAAAFSPYLMPELDDPSASAEAILSLYLDSAICHPADQRELAVYVSRNGRDWAPVEEQQLDPNLGVIHARDVGPALYVLLGPAQVRRLDETIAVDTFPFRDDAGDDLSISVAEVRIPGAGEESIAAIPFFVAEDAANTLPDLDRFTGDGETEAPLPTGQSDATPSASTDSQNRGVFPAGRAQDAEPVVVDVEPMTTDAPEVSPPPQIEAPPEVASPPEDSDLPPPEEGPLVISHTKVQASQGSGSGTRQRAEPLTLNTKKDIVPQEAAEEDANATAWVRGTNLQLRLPDGSIVLQLGNEAETRGRIRFLDTPPIALPDGIQAYSSIFQVQTKPQGVVSDVLLSVSAEAAKVSKSKAATLSLYVLTYDGVWQALPDSKYSPETNRFSALDLSPRVYVLAGP